MSLITCSEWVCGSAVSVRLFVMRMHPNIKYELQELERLMDSSPDRVVQISDVAAKVIGEVVRIKQTLIYEVFHFEDERHLERYIQYHQQSLIRLIDHAAIRIEAQANVNEVNPILYKALDELLAFIERHFTK